MSGAPGPATPRRLGYRMPPEWERHAATWIGWPGARGDWPGKFSSIPWVYAEIVRQLRGEETVEVLVSDAPQERRARRVLDRSGVDRTNVVFRVCPMDRGWLRDSGPTFLVREGAADTERVGLVHWQFNAWAKYDDWERDRRVPEFVATVRPGPLWRPERAGRWVVLEGGAFDVDGAGLLLATDECLTGEVQARNPGWTRTDYEEVFREYLGIDEVVWLPGGIAGDDTHGHIDDVARWVGPRTVVTVTSDRLADPDRQILTENRAALETFRTRDGRRLEVRELPAPRPVSFGGRRLPASYANFYVANRTVLVPTFDDPNDPVAIDVLRRAFPGREVVGIHARDLVWGLGTVHCLTQQQPAL